MTADPLAEIDALLARVPENPWVIPEPHDWRNGSPPPPASLAPELVNALRAARAAIAGLEAERDRANRNRDMWRDQCEPQPQQPGPIRRPGGHPEAPPPR